MERDLNSIQEIVSITIKPLSRDLPIVTTALKSPLAIRSISLSICCSVDEGELRISYDEWARGWDEPGWEVGGG
jgi:hypothetical protein